MSGVSLPVTRPTGRALVVANAVVCEQPVAALQALGFQCARIEDPYAAMAELAARPQDYSALVLSLAGMYREEMEIIQAVKRRFPRIDIWLTQTDGRQSTLAQAMRLGADGLLADDGMHRMALTGAAIEAHAHAADRPANSDGPAHDSGEAAAMSIPESQTHEPESTYDHQMGEPVLTADELRALLDEQPTTNN